MKIKKLFYESGNKAYIILDEKARIPKTGFHVKDKMAGFWIPPFRYLENLEFSNFNEINEIKKEKVELNYYFKNGQLKVLIPLNERSLFLNISGNTIVKLKFLETPTWLSNKKGWKEHKIKIFRENEVLYFETFNTGERYYINSTGKVERVNIDEIEIKIEKKGIIYIGDKIIKNINVEYKKAFDEKKVYYEKLNPLEWNKIESKLRNILLDLYLENNYGKGVVAGFEDFPWWFGVDTFFIGEALLKIGYFEIMKNTLETLLRYTRDFIPHEVVNNGEVNEVFNVNETFLIISSIHNFFKKTYDKNFLKDSYKILLNIGKNIIKEYGVFPKGTGFLELSHISKNVRTLDVAASVYLACKNVVELMEIGVIPKDEFWMNLKKYYDQEFLKTWYDEKEGVFYDYLLNETGKKEYHFIQLLPLYFDLIPKEIAKTIFERLKEKSLIFYKGLRHSIETREKEDSFYGKKEEKVWWIANAILKKVVKMYKIDYEMKYLEGLFENDIREYQSIPEIVNYSGGNFVQSWSVLFGLI